MTVKLFYAFLIVIMLVHSISGKKEAKGKKKTNQNEIKTYNGYQVFKVDSKTPAQSRVIAELYHSHKYDFWMRPTHGHGFSEIMAAPGQIKDLEKLLKKHKIKYSVKVKDVGKEIKQQTTQNGRSLSSEKGKMSWTAYQPFKTIELFLRSIKNPNVNVSTIGKSYEGRNLYIVKFSTGECAHKKSVLIDANLHAREWIAGAVATWIINEMTRNIKEYTSLLALVDIYIIPMLNPDGYEYSRTNDRMWRKSRSKVQDNDCIGTDLNRNFPFMFGGEGTSSDPCAFEDFKGKKPFSESESKAFGDFFLSKSKSGTKFYMYMAFHSKGNKFLYPWGFTRDAYTSDRNDQVNWAEAVVEGIKSVRGSEFLYGNAYDVFLDLGVAGGASDDWMKRCGVKYTATFEMGEEFMPPLDEIIPIAKEVWAGVQAGIRRVMEYPIAPKEVNLETTLECNTNYSKFINYG